MSLLQTSFSLRDSGGGIWAVTVDNDGLLSTSRGSGDYATPIFKATDGSDKKFRLGVDTLGLFTTTQVANDASGAIYFWRLWSPNGTQHMVCIDEIGDLLTTKNCMPPFTGGFEIGELMPQGGGYPTAIQPGGIGTPVTDPVQTANEKTGMFTAGCGHFFNSMRLQIEGYRGCPTAYLTCPVCSYLIRRISPPSEIDSQSNFILLP